MDRICVAIGEKTMAETIQLAVEEERAADVIEIRLDMISGPSVKPFLGTLTKPLLFTNRAEWEGGMWKGEEKERVALLLEAMEFGAAYVDLEERAPETSWKSLLERRKTTAAQLICSWHNFEKTPERDELLQIIDRMQERGADICKLITMANEPDDVTRLFNLFSEIRSAEKRIIAFCMGEHGVISRVATTQLGGYMTYCSTDKSDGTAPGQISASKMRRIFELMGRAEI